MLRSAAARCAAPGDSCGSRSSATELAPSNSRLMSSPVCTVCPAGSSAARARQGRASGRRNTSTAAPPPRRRARARARASRRRLRAPPWRRSMPSTVPAGGCWRRRSRPRRRSPASSTAPAACRAARSAVVHHPDVIGQHQRLGLVVRDVDEGRAEGALQLLQLELHVLAQLHVERAQGLVEQQQCRLEHHAAGDRDALALAAGELLGALGRRRRPGRRARAWPRRARSRSRLPTPRRASPKATFSRHRHHREQRQLLEHHVDRAPVGRDPGHAAAADGDLAAVGLDEAGDHAQQRGLAAAGGPEDREEAAARDAEGQLMHGGVAAEALAQRAHLQVRRCGGAGRRRLNWPP